ncbi:Protein of unknown function [Desulfotomaculum arcticum]|uniref:Uncharacterized protein n=1 Tax=Desulfotruncus arcticus DSM 17038 TaxID=1121424 RepID=A0A1I2SYF0_9FIRM|nr:DUF3231 family protein [Desulfotruncus arcticus]SFG56017.1 Protein of unknown function [Desulfotomaculum arcticum] [Desulfotruncus arcticus DSM 17038]
MEILKQMQKITKQTMSTREKQKDISVSEVFHLWNHLVQRYNVIHLTNFMEAFASDSDLKLIIALGKKTLGEHVSKLEKEMMAYGIPLPVRPPKQTQPTSNIEAITDRFIYRRVLRGIQTFLPTHMMAYIHSTSPDIRGLFLAFLIQELKLYDKFIEYGKIKSYIIMPPTYKSS